VRVFIDLGLQVMPLFDSLAQNEQVTGFADRVRAAIKMDIENQARAAARSAAAPRTDDTVLRDSETAATVATQDGVAGERDLRELLTYREMDVLMLLDQRLTNKEIAHQLGISTETVRQHTVNLFRKLNVGNRRQAIVVARSKYQFDGHG
jgi:DNA-binding NarL/FixJ family response regulator